MEGKQEGGREGGGLGKQISILGDRGKCGGVVSLNSLSGTTCTRSIIEVQGS